ncbi:MAG: AtpZ/AtpI family protein, partial [Bacteroidales bacterium]|nr:AtpZ/AtpI family protein [Bacteroidales bacterium]
MNQKQPSQKRKPPPNNYVKYSSLAIQMVVLIVFFVWGGRELDVLLSLKFPIFTLLLSLFG